MFVSIFYFTMVITLLIVESPNFKKIRKNILKYLHIEHMLIIFVA